MPFRYFTTRDAGRPQKLGVNAIEFVEIDEKNLQTIEVHLVENAPTASLPVVEIATPSGARVVTAKNPPEVKNGEPRVLLVNVEGFPDVTTYQLSLLRPNSIIAPEKFDPRRSSVDFSFEPQFVREKDCETAPRASAEMAPDPRIDYLAKDFNGFRQLMLDRMASVAPGWTERSPADLGMTLVEILAHRADLLSYFQDAVATEAYLGTARKRISLRRHARLLDYSVHEGSNARAWVYLNVRSFVRIEPGSATFLTHFSDQTVFAKSEVPGLVERFRPLVFDVLRGADLHPANGNIEFHTFSGSIECLPKGATRATLVKAPGVQVRAGDVLIFEQIKSPKTGNALDADPAKRHAVRLVRVTADDYEDPITGTELIDIVWDEQDALPFALTLASKQFGSLAVAHGNVVLVDHGLTVRNEPLEPRVVPLSEPYRPRLRRRGLMYAHVLEPAFSATSAVAMDPRFAQPAILEVVQTDGMKWEVRPDLLHSGPTDRHVVVELDDEKTAWLRFGDGTLGARPTAGTEFVVTYRIGGGQVGNVGADGITHVATNHIGIEDVRNPLPASGGIDRETNEHIRLAAPRSFRVQERAVTDQDWVVAAERFPGVRKAASFRRFTGSFITHFIAVIRPGGAAVDDEFKSNLRDFLERFRLSGTEVLIVAPVFVPLEITLLVRIASGHLRSASRVALASVFGASTQQDGRRGFFDPDNFSFGESVYLGQVISEIMRVPGIESIDTTDSRNRFGRAGGGTNELRQGKINIGPLEIATRGKVEFNVEGGL